MASKANIQSNEELESEKQFSLFSFYAHWAVYCVFFLYKLELNFIVLASAFSFSLFRFLAIQFKLKNHRIYLWNHLASISLIVFFTSFFLALPKNDVNKFLDWQLYFVTLSFTIIHESMRVHKYAYLFVGALGTIIYSIVILTVEDFASLDVSYKFIIPYLFLAYCTSAGYFINRIKREAITYYVGLLHDKISVNRDMGLARTVQESLFPKIKTIKGLRFEIFRKSHNQIGGDFYDFIQLREGNVGIFITDVAGHGYSSAMVAAMLKVMVSTLPYYLKLDPSGLLTYLDKKISGEFKSHHATALYLFIDFLEENILLSNAGHPYFIYSKKGEPFQEIETSGTLLGFGLQDPVADTVEFPYQSGDRFFIYTDGLLENTNSKNDILEPEGLLNILNLYKDEENLGYLKESVISELHSYFGKTDFSDDAMFLLFEIE